MKIENRPRAVLVVAKRLALLQEAMDSWATTMPSQDALDATMELLESSRQDLVAVSIDYMENQGPELRFLAKDVPRLARILDGTESKTAPELEIQRYIDRLLAAAG